MNKAKLHAAIKTVGEKLCSMAPKQFAKELEAHWNGDITKILLGSGALQVEEIEVSEKRKTTMAKKLIHLGKTGDFPEGSLGEADEGGLRLGIIKSGGEVVILFGTPVSWFSLSVQQAKELSELIVKVANGEEKKVNKDLLQTLVKKSL